MLHKDLNQQSLATQPIEIAETIPSSWYTDPWFDRFDRDHVFSRCWQLVGHLSQVSNPGDVLIGDVASTPVMVVRDKSGTLRAFHNVCKHRGGPLACVNGNVSMLKCQYHGWTYRLDGSLRGVPRFDRADLFDKSDYGLEPIELDVYHGLVFVSLSKPRSGVESVLAGIAERISPIDMNDLAFRKQVVYDVKCNWKVYVDNYLEGYHLPHVHPELCNVLQLNDYITETAEHYSLQYSPFKDCENAYQLSGGEAFYYYVYPNIMLNILPGRLQTNRVDPTGPNSCRVIFDYFYANDHSGESAIEADLAFSDKVQAEDIDICEKVQLGLQSPAYDKGRFSVECEVGVHHFQALLKQTYRRASEAL